jgi:hypothetical protein
MSDINPFFSSQNNNVSASPNIVSHLIDRNGGLEPKVSITVIYPDRNEIEVYRKSSLALGKWSLDIHRLRPIEFIRKAKEKYDNPPLPPQGAYTYTIKGVKFYAMAELTQSDITRLTNFTFL